MLADVKRWRPVLLKSICKTDNPVTDTDHSTENKVLTPRMSCLGTDQTCSWGTEFRFNVRSLDVCWMKNRQFQFNSIRIERKVKKVSCVNFFRDRKIGVSAPGDTCNRNGGTMQTAAQVPRPASIEMLASSD